LEQRENSSSTALEAASAKPSTDALARRIASLARAWYEAAVASEHLSQYLEPTWFLDCDSPAVQEFTKRVAAGASGPRAQAIALFYAVRDSILYDPYTFSIDREHYRSSRVTQIERSFCVPKAILLASAGRALGIPSRLGFADVRNHLATPKLLELLGSDLFVFHGYVEFYLDSRWVKATPAFNETLCERFGVLPLEFDGVSDALFQPFDAKGRQYMEYLEDRGTYPDLPFDEMLRALGEVYGKLGKRLNPEERDAPFHDE
jgi:transglutaminase-like putative cysteine protease